MTAIDALSQTGVADGPRRVQRDLTRLREAAGTVVGTTFFGTLLKQMRESQWKGPYGHGGRGEEIFSAQLHGLFAERIGNQMKRGLGDALYRRLEGQQTRISQANVQTGGLAGL